MAYTIDYMPTETTVKNNRPQPEGNRLGAFECGLSHGQIKDSSIILILEHGVFSSVSLTSQ
jgi:hypothetical protein